MITDIFVLAAGLLVVPQPLRATTSKPQTIRFPSTVLQRDYRNADAYIKSLLEEHERAFPGAIRYEHLSYYAGLSKLSYIQQKLLIELSKHPEFYKDWSEREPLTDISVTVIRPIESENSIQLNKRRWNMWKIKWQSLALQVASHRSSKKQILDRLAAELEAAAVHRALPSLRAMQEFHTLLSGYLIIGGILNTPKQRRPAAVLMSRLRDLEVGALDFMQDAQVYKPLLSRLKVKITTDTLDKVHKAISENVFSEPIDQTLNVGDQLHIKEVHPNVGIFRGYVGNDCSTSFSPGFALNPFDRYYYIFDQDGHSLGYLGLTLVEIAGRKAVFVHTVQGPDLTAAQTDLILRTIKTAAPKIFRTDLVVLGPDHSIRANMNFFPIIRTMLKAVAEEPPRPMRFLDHHYREIIAANGSTLDYDSPEVNSHGRELRFNETDVISVEISQKPFSADFQKPNVRKLRKLKAACEGRLIR